MLTDELRAKIDALVNGHSVLLFMKGNKQFPQCGFSNRVVNMLREIGTPFEAVNVLADAEMREGIKEYTEWPTIPQLYVRGEFVGGCDIVTEMYQSGELHALLGVPQEEVAAPTITLDEGARSALSEAAREEGDEHLRLTVTPDFKHDLYFGPAAPGDVVAVADGVALRLDRQSAKRAQGLRIEWVPTGDGGAFRIDNPNAPPSVRSLSAKELSAWRAEKRAFTLIDVRPEGERRAASIEGAVALDAMDEATRAKLAKDAALVFYCHHGHRSRSAAERFLAEGYRNVYNLEGGVDAWSRDVDSSVPTY